MPTERQQVLARGCLEVSLAGVVRHIMHLLESPADQETWRDELADGCNGMVRTIKEAAFASLQVVMIVVFNIIWWTFLIIVALPIVWDWFWQLPPGLQ